VSVSRRSLAIAISYNWAERVGFGFENLGIIRQECKLNRDPILSLGVVPVRVYRAVKGTRKSISAI